MSDFNVTKAAYDALVEEEDKRLDTHPIERAVTLDTILGHLEEYPKLPASSRCLKVADIGGGTGVYAFALADKGYSVHLRDLSPQLLQVAIGKQAARLGSSHDGVQGTLTSISEGNAVDARSLFPASEEGTFDAVLLLGPPYHLLEERERRTALQNALALLKPSGVLFAAFLPRNAHLRNVAVRDPSRLVREMAFYEEYLRTGKYVRRGPRNSESYHATLDEIKPLVASAGGRVLETIGTEGILGGGLDRNIAEANEETRDAWVTIMKQLGRVRENLGNADHWLVVIAKL